MSHQFERLKVSTMDIRLSAEFDRYVAANTEAFAS